MMFQVVGYYLVQLPLGTPVANMGDRRLSIARQLSVGAADLRLYIHIKGASGVF